jgi:hypothetical protein
MNKIGLKGQIEILLEDKRGNVKRREVHDNTITDAYLKHALYGMMTASNFVNTTRATAGGTMSVGAPGNFGIYAMSIPVNIQKDTYRAPYVNESGTALHPDVAFYNLAGGATESAMEMIPVDARSFFHNGHKAEFTLEYVKNTYTGTIRSVIIGRQHASLDQMYALFIKDPDYPAELYTSGTNYLLEHTDNGTILYKIPVANTQFALNMKTKAYLSFANTSMNANIISYFGGLIVNNAIFKVAKKSNTTTSYVVTLTFVPNWKDSTTAQTLDITFTARSGMASTSGTYLPVLVSKPNNKLEIFLTLSTGNHSGEVGANIQKAVVDVSDLGNITYNIVDMGIIPYAVSGYGTTVGQYMTGLFHEGNYHLPYYSVVNGAGSVADTTTSSYQEGVIISNDLATVRNIVNYRRAANEFNAFVAREGGAVQCRVNTAASNFITATQIVSGANLDVPITKGNNDILRIIYRYILGL